MVHSGWAGPSSPGRAALARNVLFVLQSGSVVVADIGFIVSLSVSPYLLL